MDFNRFLLFLSIYSLPEEKKAFFFYFEKKIQENSFLKIVGIMIPFILLIALLFINFFFFKNIIWIKALKILFSLLLIINFINLKESLKIFENLLKNRLIYEESSWFDLEIWEKPVFHLKYDHLISKNEKKKIKTNIMQTSYLTILYFLIG